MKKMSKMISIIFTLIVLQSACFSVNTAFASAIDHIVSEYNIKDKLQNFLYDTGRKLLHNFSNSLSSGKNAAPAGKKLQGKTIVIDPGHGGHNPGAVRGALRESDNNLAVSLKMAELLKEQGANVVLTRAADRSLVDKSRPLKDELQARVDIARSNSADLFVSVHTNSNENDAIQGAMTFYYDAGSKKLAQDIQNGMIAKTQATDKGIAPGNFLVLRNSSIPAVLVEMGFITNPKEAAKLNEDGYRAKMAEGIAAGVAAYLTSGA